MCMCDNKVVTKSVWKLRPKPRSGYSANTQLLENNQVEKNLKLSLTIITINLPFIVFISSLSSLLLFLLPFQGSSYAFIINCSISMSTGGLLVLILAFHYKDIRVSVPSPRSRPARGPGSRLA